MTLGRSAMVDAYRCTTVCRRAPCPHTVFPSEAPRAHRGSICGKRGDRDRITCPPLACLVRGDAAIDVGVGQPSRRARARLVDDCREILQSANRVDWIVRPCAYRGEGFDDRVVDAMDGTRVRRKCLRKDVRGRRYVAKVAALLPIVVALLKRPGVGSQNSIVLHYKARIQLPRKLGARSHAEAVSLGPRVVPQA